MTAAPDSSVLVPALLAPHPLHALARSAMSRAVAVPSHVLLESFSVLTRLPVPYRISARDAAAALSALALPVLAVDGAAQLSLVRSAGDLGLNGGAIHDALVALTAREHGLTLVTADRRAVRAYAALDVRYELVS